MRRLEVLGDGLDGILLEHASGVLLAEWVPSKEINNLPAVE
jgi:hypothetical protein